MQTKIKNRLGLEIVTELIQAKQPVGLAIIAHGLGGFKDQPHIQTYAQAFTEANYTVLLYDATNSIGQSGGRMEDATATSYCNDLEDVITWASQQDWYVEPFILAGHSMGSFACLLYAEKFPEKVKALAPTSTVVSGDLLFKALNKEKGEEMKKWQEIGYEIRESSSKPGVKKKISWNFMEDIKKYDVLPKIELLTMPVLLLVGDADTTTPLEQQQLLYNKLSGPKELHIIKDSKHTFWQPEHFTEIKQFLGDWLKKI